MPNAVVSLVVFAVLWAMPLFFASGKEWGSDVVPTLFMGSFTLWTLPAWGASLLGAVVSVVLLAVICNAAQRHTFIPSRTMMPVVVGMLLTSSIGCLHCFDHKYIALILFFLAVDQMMKMYDYKQQPKAAFNIALLLIGAALFEPMYVWLLASFVIGLVIYRIVSWRISVSMTIGVLLMIYIIVSVAWLFDATGALAMLAEKAMDFEVINPAQWHWTDIGLALLLTVLWGVTILNYITHRGSYSLNIRLNFLFLCWCLAVALVLMAFVGTRITDILPIPILLLTLLSSLYFTTNRSNAANIVFVLFVAALVLYRVLGAANSVAEIGAATSVAVNANVG